MRQGGETGSVSKRMMPPTFEEMLTLASESLSLVFRGVGVVVVLDAAGVDFLAGPTSPRLGRVDFEVTCCPGDSKQPK